MPPRYAYWTILIDNAPTAFRAKDQEDLLPTLQQLRRTNQNVTLKWFAHGRIWDSPELAVRPRPPREDAGVKRGQDWRPGGQHKDPRARFDKTKKKDRPDWKTKAPDSREPRHDRPRGDGQRFDRPRDQRPSGDRPRPESPRRDRPPSDRPPSGRPQAKPFAKSYAPKRPWQDRPRSAQSGGSGSAQSGRSGGDRDQRGPGGSSGRRPFSGPPGHRASGGDVQKPWRPKPPWQPRDNDRSDRPWQGRPNAPASGRDRSPSSDRRPPIDRRPPTDRQPPAERRPPVDRRPSTDRRPPEKRRYTPPGDKRPYAPRGDRPRDGFRGKPNDQRSGWQGKPKPYAGRPPVRRNDAGDERARKPKTPKKPGGSDSE